MERNKNLLKLTTGVLALVLLITGCSGTTRNTTTEPTNQQEATMETIAESADKVQFEKAFSLTDVKGNTVNLSDFSGKKVYVKFWATWCSICLAGMDELIAFHESVKDNEDIVVLTIVASGSSGEMNAEDFRQWYEKQGYTFPVLLDEGAKVTRDFGIRGYPTSIIYDTDGKITTNRPGHVDRETLETLLGILKE